MSLQFAAINVSNLFINASVNSYGVVCSAVSGVGTKLNSIMGIVAAALISAGATMVGQNFGAGKLDRINKVFYSIMAVTVSFAILLAAIVMLFPSQVFHLFSKDNAVLAMAKTYAPVSMLCFLGAGLRAPAISFVNGIGATTMNYIMGIMDGVVVRIGLAWFMGSVPGSGHHPVIGMEAPSQDSPSLWWAPPIIGLVGGKNVFQLSDIYNTPASASWRGSGGIFHIYLSCFTIAPIGHTSWQVPQAIHTFWSISYFSSPGWIHSMGQFQKAAPAGDTLAPITYILRIPLHIACDIFSRKTARKQ